MNKLFILVLSASLLACNNEGEGAGVIDSLEARKDTLIQNVDSTTRAKTDSLQQRGSELKQSFDSTIDARVDSVRESGN